MEESFVFVQGDMKKRSVIYECEEARMSFYIRREVLERLGYPEVLKVTLEVVEEKGDRDEDKGLL